MMTKQVKISKAGPTTNDVHVNRPLTQFSVGYIQDSEGYVHGKVFPFLSVSKKSDLYFEYDKGDMLRGQAKERKSGNESAGMDYAIARNSYFSINKALHIDIGDDERANEDDPLDQEVDATEILTQKQLITREKDWFDSFFKTGIWFQDFDVNASALEWDLAGSDPIVDMSGQILNLKRQTGQNPKQFKATTTPEVWNILENHEVILDRIKFTQKGIVSQDLVASLLGIGEFLVADAIHVTGRKGSATENESSFIASTKGVLISFSPDTISKKRPCAGKIFTWKGRNGELAISSDVQASGVGITKFRMNHLKSDRIESEMSYDMKVVATDAAKFMFNVIS